MIVDSFRRLTLAGVLVASLGLAACTQEPDPAPTATPGEVSATPTTEATPTASEQTTPAPTSTIPVAKNLDGIKVTGEAGKQPQVTVPTPWAIDSTQTKVLIPSDNPQKLVETSRVNLHYVGYNGRTGEVFDSSWQRGEPITFPLDKVIVGFKKGLTGQAVGSRVLIGMPSEDGYPQGNGDTIAPGDNLIFVVDILSANYEEAAGQAVTPDASLPKVTMGDQGPELAKPSGKAPTKLVVQPLIKGAGEKVTEDSRISVKFRSWNWADGKLIEDEWQPQASVLSRLIEGWRKGLAGQTVGSRVMLVVPPELAYPDGESDRGIPPGTTLVYVLDILEVGAGS